jgi:hypothetical protein
MNTRTTNEPVIESGDTALKKGNEKNSRMLKVAGLSFVGFCAVSLAADRVSLSPAVAQLAGFGGAFLGALSAKLHTPGKLKAIRRKETPPAVPEAVTVKTPTETN